MQTARARWTLLLPAAGWVWLAGLSLAGLLGLDVRRHHFEAAGIALGAGIAAAVCVAPRRAMAAPVARHPSPGATATLLAIPFASAIAAFGWSITLGPLSDDFVLHRWASAGNWAPDEWAFLRPVPLAMWHGVLAIGGDWRAIHAMNVLAHGVNSGLVALLGASLVGPRAGIAAGVVFAMFPASAEAVAWSAGIFDVTATMFVLLAAFLWTRLPPSTKRTTLVATACVAGMLSKESAIVIPAILAVISLLTLRGGWPDLRGHARGLGLVALTAIGFASLRVALSPSLAGHVDNLPADRSQWKDLVVRPFAAVAAPARTEEGLTSEVYLMGLAVLLVIGVALAQTSARRSDAREHGEPGRLFALILGGAWILLGALPLLLQFYVAPTLEGSRYLYLPAAGFALALSGRLAARTRSSLIAAIGLVALLGLYGNALRTEHDVWRDAAATRGAILSEAAAAVRRVPCRTLRILDAPDHGRGAFVFRQGLSEATAQLPLDPEGADCVVQWTGTALVPAGPTRAE